MGNENSGLNDIFEVIRDAYMRASPELPIYDLDIPKRYIDVLERWIFIDMQRSKDYPKQKTSEILKLYRRKFGKSEALFYSDKKNCERLFGELSVINKDYEKKIAIQNYDAIFSLSLAKGDLKSATEALTKKCVLMGLYDKDEAERIGGGDKSYFMVSNIILDGKKIEEKRIDISNLQDLSIKDLKAIGEMVSTPDVDVELMSEMIDNSDNDKQ